MRFFFFFIIAVDDIVFILNTMLVSQFEICEPPEREISETPLERKERKRNEKAVLNQQKISRDLETCRIIPIVFIVHAIKC